MNLFDSILLGIVQGLTEFLPVSSSAHLALLEDFLGFASPGLIFDIVLHLGTLAAILVYFRKRIGTLIAAFFGIFFTSSTVSYFENKKFLWGIVVASIPTALLGLALKGTAEAVFLKPAVIGYLLVVTSMLLYFIGEEKSQEKRGEVTLRRAFLVGIAQGIAVFPGLSRSGLTIFMGIKAGLSRERAAEFSFLVSIPAIIGALILEGKHLPNLSAEELRFFAAGFAAAFISGLLAISLMMNLVKRAKLDFFALYCLLLGLAAVMWR